MNLVEDARAHLLAPKYLGWLFDGWVTTLWAALVVIAASTLLGVGFAAARTSARAWVRRLAALYLSAFRNTPLLVQLFFWYFGAPSQLPEAARDWLNAGHRFWPSFEVLSALVGLALYATAFVGEELRSGMRGVPVTQLQAGTALGFTRAQLLRHVVLPQAVRIAMSPLLGQYMNIVKNTSLAMAVGLVELSYTARQVEAETFKTFQAFGFATLFYVITITALEILSARVARRQAALPRG